MITYTCPKCGAPMLPEAIRVQPPARRHRCIMCGYMSKPEPVKEAILPLPRELWSEEEGGDEV